MNILHLLAPSEAGGLESVVRLLTMGQTARGHGVCVGGVVGPGMADHPFMKALSDSGVGTACLTVPGRAYLRERQLVSDLCRRMTPDVVHTHGFRPDVVDAPVARRFGVPTITTVHGFTGGGWKVQLYERVQRRAFRRFDAVVAVSHALAETLVRAGVPGERLHVVPNAYPATPPAMDRARARRRLALPDDAFVIAWVGRLSREKGPDVFVDALACLGDLPVIASVVGSGPEQEDLATRAHRLGVGEKIRWHGSIPEIASYFRAFDVLALSSRTEGSPVVVFEAMAANLPIAAAAVGGVGEILSPAEAVLVPPENPAALAHALRLVYCDRPTASARADAAFRRLATEFDADSWVSRYEALYRRIQKPSAQRSR